MKTFIQLNFDIAKCKTELQEFKNLLDSKVILQEQKDILPFFKKFNHLSAFFASFNPYISKFDQVANELSLFGDFTCDLVAGDTKESTYCLVEFEDAAPESVFHKVGKKSNREWANRFDHGYSQLIDWFWKIDSMRNTVAYEDLFGSRDAKFTALLVIGRKSNLTKTEQNRLSWRLEKVLIDSIKVNCLTYDDLFIQMQNRLDLYS